jgi:hypothetical protein
MPELVQAAAFSYFGTSPARLRRVVHASDVRFAGAIASDLARFFSQPHDLRQLAERGEQTECDGGLVGRLEG